jgi:hypothetical protein
VQGNIMDIKKHLYNHLFFYLVLFFILIALIISFCRFMIARDYVVGYEGVCDPIMKECFVGCEDEECTKEYYYTKMEKYAPDLYAECGEDITDCEEANICLPSDNNCSIVYCNSEIDGDSCETLTEEDGTQSDDQEINQEKLLEDN